MKRYFLLLLFTLLFFSCSEDHVGGGTEGGNVDLAGTIDTNGVAIAGARIALFPVGYNPNISSDTMSDTIADASGAFMLSDVDTGHYKIKIVSADSSLSVLQDLYIQKSDSAIKRFELQPIGGVTLLLDRSIDTSAKVCYIPNTDILLPLSRASLDNSGNYWKLEYDKLPAGAIDSFILWNTTTATAGEVVAKDVAVESGKHLVVGDDFNWVPVSKGTIPFDVSTEVYNVIERGDSLFFATNIGLYSFADGQWLKEILTNTSAQIIYDIEKMSNGYFHLGTASGIDLETSTGWKDSSFENIGENQVYDIFKDNSDGYWYALGGNGLVHDNGASIHYLISDLQDQKVKAVTQSENGSLWMLSESGTVVTQKDDSFAIVTKSFGAAKAITGGVNGELWALADEGLYNLSSGGSWTEVQSGVEFDAIYFDQDSKKLFALTDNDTLMIYSAGSWDSYNFTAIGQNFEVVVKDGVGIIYSGQDFLKFNFMY